jgi:hypothetical protein
MHTKRTRLSDSISTPNRFTAYTTSTPRSYTLHRKRTFVDSVTQVSPAQYSTNTARLKKDAYLQVATSLSSCTP